MSRAADYYSKHGADCLARYRATGDLSALRVAVDDYRQLILLTRERSQDAPVRRFLLCIALRELYDVTKDLAVLQEAVAVGSAAAKAMSPTRPSYVTGALNLAIAARELGLRTRNLEHVDAAIGYGRWAVSTLGPGHALRPDAFVDLADALHAGYELTEDVNTLSEAIAVGWQALDLIPERHASRISAPYRLGQYLEEMYQRTQDPRALDDAVRVARWGAQVSYGDPHHADHLRLLANLLRDVYRDRGEVGSLQEAVHLLRTAASQLPGESRNAVFVLMSLGAALASLGEQTGDVGVMRESVHWLRQALAGCGEDSAFVATVVKNLAFALMSLYSQTKELDVLQEAVQHGRRSLQATPQTNPRRGERAGELAVTLSLLATNSGGNASLGDEAKGLFREAVSSTTGDEQMTYRYGLWRELWSEYHQNRALPLLLEATEQIRAVAAAADPTGDEYGDFQEALGVSLLPLYTHTGDPQTLDEAVCAWREAVRATQAGDSVRYRRRRESLATALLKVFERDHAEPALDEAIDALRNVVSAAEGPPARLVSALLMKFRRTGNLADLEEAIAFGRRAAELQEDNPKILSDLASSLYELFNQTGDSSAGNEAIDLLQRAVRLIPRGDPDKSTALSNFAASVDALARRLQSEKLGDDAIDLARLAADDSPPGHPNRSTAMNNLGTYLFTRYRRTRQAADLREATAVLNEAVNESASPQARFNLACAKAGLEETDGDAAHIREAVSLARQALRDVDSPALRARISLEIGLWQYRLITGYGDRLLEEEALDALAGAMAAEEAPPHLRLEAARSRAEILTYTQRWHEALADYTAAVGLIGQVAARHLVADDKQHQLDELTSLGADAAACALNAGQPRRAVELSEHTRGVLIAEAFDEDADLTQLRANAPDLAARLTSLRNQLPTAVVVTLPAMSTSDDETDIIAPDAPAEQQHRLGQQWNDLLRDIRSLPGFETFLQPASFETLTAAAEEGPVALLNVSRLRCDAIVLPRQDGGITDPQVIRLPGIDPEKVARHAELMLAHIRPAWFTPQAGTQQGTVEDVLEWLWNAAIEPVLDGLGLISDSPPAPLPRIWWCPTDLLSYLPLHAAGKENAGPGNRDCALDHVVSSYTPTIRALARQFAARQAHDPVSALVVAVADASGAQELPGVAAEARAVVDSCRGALVLEGPQACYEVVAAAMNSHSLVHFACHAISDQGAPAESYLVLHDHDQRPLTVTDIIQNRTGHDAELAFLSACSTAQTWSGRVNEALHITSAFLIAGFPQVIGTLWQVWDTLAVEIVRDFYASYLPDHTGRPAPTAAYPLHEAVKRAASRYPKDPMLWAPFVHVGR